MKRVEREAILCKSIERGTIGKQSAFTLRGADVWLSDFLYFGVRTRKDLLRMASQERCNAPTPPHLRCSTPEPDTWDARYSAEFLPKFTREIEAYKLRSNGMGASTNGIQLHDKVSSQSVVGSGDP